MIGKELHSWHGRYGLALLTGMICAFLTLIILVSLINARGALETFEPLVKNDHWHQKGKFPRFQNPVPEMEIPAQMTRSAEFVVWRSWTAEEGSIVASIATKPFAPSPFMAIPILGFPNEYPGSRIFLRCDQTAAEWDLATARTNTQWSTVYVDMRDKPCPSMVTLHAVNNHSEAYVGVGTPFRVAKGAFEAHNGFGPRALTVILTWLGGAAVILVVSLSLGTRSAAIALPIGMVGLAALGMLEFSVHAAPPAMQSYLKYAMLGLGVTSAVYLAIRVALKPNSLDSLNNLRLGLLAWLLVALFYAAIVSVGDNGAGAWSINGLFAPARWSTDNQLPYLFAENLIQMKPAADMQWGPWLASDRTPLMTGLLLAVRGTFLTPMAVHYGTDFLPTAYMMASIVVLTSWVPLVFWIASIARVRPVSAIFILAVTSSFFFFNSVFAWGKLLGGTYAVLAFGLLHLLSQEKIKKDALIIVAACASASYLSHASNLLSLAPIALYYMRTILRQGLTTILLAASLSILIAFPWFYWLMYAQPGGSTLVRYFLTGDFGFERRYKSVLPDVVAAYRALGPEGIILEKLRAFRFMLDVDASWSLLPEVQNATDGPGFLASSRVLDFFILTRALWIAMVAPAVAFFVVGRDRKPTDSRALSEAAMIGLGGLFLTFCLSLAPSYLHHQAYGSVQLLFIFGALCACNLPVKLRHSIVALSTLYFASVWMLAPIQNVTVLLPGTTICVGATAIALFLLYLHVDPPSPKNT